MSPMIIFEVRFDRLERQKLKVEPQQGTLLTEFICYWLSQYILRDGFCTRPQLMVAADNGSNPAAINNCITFIFIFQGFPATGRDHHLQISLDKLNPNSPIKPSSSLKSLITPSDVLHLNFGTSFLHHLEFLIQIIHPPLTDLRLNMPVLLFHHFTLSVKLTFSENHLLHLFHDGLFLSFWLISRL